MLIGCETILDPFGGVGKLALVKDYGFTGKVVCNELEREWAETGKYNVDEWHIGDAANMTWAESNSFDAICTSPPRYKAKQFIKPINDDTKQYSSITEAGFF